jgi:hypothetical protein
VGPPLGLEPLDQRDKETHVSGILQTLKAWLLTAGSRRAYRPDFSDEKLFRTLALAGDRHPLLADASTAFQRGDRQIGVVHVVEHFRGRQAPKFLFDLDQLSTAVAEIEQQYPEWKRRTIAQSIRDAEQGISVYGRPTRRLTSVDGWLDAMSGPGDDVVYSVWPHFFEFAPRMALAAQYGVPGATWFQQILSTWLSLPGGRASELRYLTDLTVGRRILALSWAWAFLAAGSRADQAGHELEFALLKVLRTDGEFLAPLVHEAAPNNHKLTSAFVLWYLGTLFPELTGGRDWQARGREVWLTELERQTLPDGGEFEHAFGYHRSVCEAAVVFILLGDRNGELIPDWVRERTRRALELHARLGEVPSHPLGDCADYSLFPFQSWTGWTVASMRELARALFQDSIAIDQEDDDVEQAFWLLGGSRAKRTVVPERAFEVHDYQDAGCFLFSSRDPGTDLLFRTGPGPGRPVFAGHMHSDLLTVYLRSRGTPVVVEAGTYTYRMAAGPWRRYFAGPESHNGLAIAGHDPLGLVSADFRPRDIGVSVESRFGEGNGLIGWAEGTLRGPQPFDGYRRGVIALDLGFWVLYDVLPNDAPLRDVSFGFQLDASCQVALEGDGAVTVDAHGQPLVIIPSRGFAQPTCAIGQLEPPAGWVAPRYGELVAAPQIRFASDQTRRATAFVIAQSEVAARCRSIDLETAVSGTIIINIVWTDYTDRIVIVGPDTASALVCGGQFNGRVLWLRTHGTQPLALRWLGGTSIRLEELGLDLGVDGPPAAVGVAMTNGRLAVTTAGGGSLRVRWPGATAVMS